MTTTYRHGVHHSAAYANRRDRDRELVRHVGRHGVISIEHAMAAQGVGRTAAYRRAASCIDAGLLERLEILRHQPSLLRATRRGLRYSGLDGLPVARVSPGGVDHALRCATVGRLLERRYGTSHVLTERELMLAEAVEDRLIASTRLGSRGRPALHRPDLAALTDEGVLAVEVELTPKSPRRLAAIIAAWAAADHVTEVHYVCAPGMTRRAVERAVAKVRAGHKVAVSEVPR